MTLSPLRQFISRLEADGDLSRISVSVDPCLEIAAVTDRVCKQQNGGRALLFEHPANSRFQVAANLFGSMRRICIALGVADMDELHARLLKLLDRITSPGSGISSLERQIAALPEFKKFAPKAVGQPDRRLIQMTNPDLTVFPFPQNWPGDGSADGYPRYITMAQVFTADPDGGTANCGLYRVQLRGGRKTAIQWKAGSGAARHAEMHRRLGRAMPVAIILGGDPTVLFSAMFPLPGNLDEITFAGFLRGAHIETVPCRNIPLQVPAGAEILIEGYVEPGETVTEGPFGNHTGFYSPAAPAALMRVSAISHREDAVIPATVVGPPPMEDCWMARAWERLLLAFLQIMTPAIKNVSFPSEWVFHQSAIISLENPRPHMVRDISARLWALPWFSSARLLLFTDGSTEPTDYSRTAWKALNTADFTKDIIMDRATGRMAIDATGCRIPRPELMASADCNKLVEHRWKEYGLA